MQKTVTDRKGMQELRGAEGRRREGSKKEGKAKERSRSHTSLGQPPCQENHSVFSVTASARVPTEYYMNGTRSLFLFRKSAAPQLNKKYG